jgi:hypothetical protein
MLNPTQALLLTAERLDRVEVAMLCFDSWFSRDFSRP